MGTLARAGRFLVVGALSLSTLACGAASSASPCQLPVPVTAGWEAPDADIPAGARVRSVEFEGEDGLPRAQLRDRVSHRVGEPLDPERLAADVRALLALDVIDDVAVFGDVSPEGVRLRFALRPRPRIAALHVSGEEPAPHLSRRLHALEGSLYDPARLARTTRRALEAHHDLGYRRAQIETRVGVRAEGEVELCIELAMGPLYRFEGVVFAGVEQLTEAELAALLRTEDGRVNTPGGRYAPDTLDEDLERLRAHYYDQGLLAMTVAVPELVLDDDARVFRARLAIYEGARFRFREVFVDPPYDEAIGPLPQPGAVASRSVLVDLKQRLEAHVAEREPDALVSIETDLDFEASTLSVVLSVDSPRADDADDASTGSDERPRLGDPDSLQLEPPRDLELDDTSSAWPGAFE